MNDHVHPTMKEALGNFAPKPKNISWKECKDIAHAFFNMDASNADGAQDMFFFDMCISRWDLFERIIDAAHDIDPELIWEDENIYYLLKALRGFK